MGAQRSFEQVWMMSKLASSLQGRGYQFRYKFLEDFGSQMEPKKNAKVESDLLTIEFRGSSDFVQPYIVFARFC